MKLVLFLNMGGASNLQECELFLKNMFNDPYILNIKNNFLRKTLAWIITKARKKAMQENYKQMGGKSPLNQLTQSLCDKLNAQQNHFHFDFVNLYVPPFAKEVLLKYSLSSKDDLILFPLYPHHSSTTVTTSLQFLQKQIQALKIPAKLTTIDVFYKDPLYNQMILTHILEKQKQSQAKILIFSAHSLPLSVIKKGDLYEQHVNEHFHILKQNLKDHFQDFILSYQSKLGPIKWLEPSTSQILADLKAPALIYPISFCIDCSETIFELGIEYKYLTKHPYDLISCPNDTKEFIHFILNTLQNQS
ncbi:ferrochelatase [Campylobacter sp. VicNov18]|uniref:ferrochelatase n=1 Tax=Campylobacter bilis TaxID=2691918 RepID=UPI00130E3DFE|nr:ferrochelatase [Campylobacter bilis]MPV64159.1 ferrochelatase [Campylobacter hepaticus]MBM0637662.1 ferrochelatase [Campylobacter bilis]MCC8278387.1 ferrochelatase [Campylobacter bilis]MCC8299890.1 ferrochelatase [Campylobacter bilis]MCC8301296.1 ferrochelatase [Campylobacter bilis]